jgi:hypothetical protein
MREREIERVREHAAYVRLRMRVYMCAYVGACVSERDPPSANADSGDVCGRKHHV